MEIPKTNVAIASSMPSINRRNCSGGLRETTVKLVCISSYSYLCMDLYCHARHHVTWPGNDAILISRTRFSRATYRAFSSRSSAYSIGPSVFSLRKTLF